MEGRGRTGVWSSGLGWPFSRSRRLSVRVTHVLGPVTTKTDETHAHWQPDRAVVPKMCFRVPGCPGSLNGEGGSWAPA